MKDPEQNLVRRVLTDPVHILAFGLGTGLAPFAPGTVGSLLGVLLAWLTLDLGLTTQIGLAVLLFVAGIWICGESSKRLGVHDHGGIVWDEVAGMFVTLLAAPATLRAWILGF
ncbi:MAG: phosphatidylglycerophosphatase A, partial [Gammaproteobacteria bacterium]|nr:phosphatidylglycerophosphatase A [Gammaproteobacteria bacterium]